MTYTIILLSIALAVSVGFWIRADRMAAHYRRERDADRERLKADADRLLNIKWRHAREMAAKRRQLAAARGQITKLRKRLGEIE